MSKFYNFIVSKHYHAVMQFGSRSGLTIWVQIIYGYPLFTWYDVCCNIRGGGLCPSCKIQRGGGLCPSCKIHGGDFVHVYKNEQEGFCPGGFCPTLFSYTIFLSLSHRDGSFEYLNICFGIDLNICFGCSKESF